MANVPLSLLPEMKVVQSALSLSSIFSIGNGGNGAVEGPLPIVGGFHCTFQDFDVPLIVHY